MSLAVVQMTESQIAVLVSASVRPFARMDSDMTLQIGILIVRHVASLEVAPEPHWATSAITSVIRRPSKI